MLTIVVVDDNLQTEEGGRNLMSEEIRLLQEHGHRVLARQDADAGLDAILSLSPWPDRIVVDYNLARTAGSTGRTGLDLIADLHRRGVICPGETKTHERVIFQSNALEPALVAGARAHGVKYFWKREGVPTSVKVSMIEDPGSAGRTAFILVEKPSAPPCKWPECGRGGTGHLAGAGGGRPKG